MSLVGESDIIAPRKADRRAFLQEFLGTEGNRPFDVRVYVVGGRVVGAMNRFANGDEWRTNVALGRQVQGFSDDLPAEASQLALQAADVFDLDYAGVDLIRNDGKWYVLEVNATAGFKGLFKATGTSPAPYIARLAIERADGFVDGERVSELAKTLDDSIPDCKPSIESGRNVSETVGYTERVAISGGQRIEQAIAKADTGAKRTCIDFDIAADLEAGPVVDTTRVKSGASNGRQKRPLVELTLKVGDRWLSTTASLEDRSHMTHPVLLGRDVLEGCRVDVSQRVAEE